MDSQRKLLAKMIEERRALINEMRSDLDTCEVIWIRSLFESNDDEEKGEIQKQLQNIADQKFNLRQIEEQLNNVAIQGGIY